MIHLRFPYGKVHQELTLPHERVTSVLTSALESYRPDVDAQALVQRALENPIGTQSLRQLSRGKQRVTIIASDHTRPVPSRLLMPALLQEIHCVSASRRVVPVANEAFRPNCNLSYFLRHKRCLA